MRKREPGAPLSVAELKQRRDAARSRNRHQAETAPSVRQGSTGAPSRAATGLFRQGQQRPDTRSGRGVWDTRTTEAPVGSMNARFRLHLPQAYRSTLPESLLPYPMGRPLLAAALADQPQGKRIRNSRNRLTQHRDLTIENPGTFTEAMRHPRMREILQHAVGVVRDHQKGAIERGYKKGMIPAGTPVGLAARAYKHAALLAMHRAGVGHYDFAMDAASKREFAPLEGFMRYAHRRVFDRLHTESPASYEPFKEEFGTPFRSHRHGKLAEAGKPRYRMAPQNRFIKLEKIGVRRALRIAGQHVGDLIRRPTAPGKKPSFPQIKRDLLRANFRNKERFLVMDQQGKVLHRKTGSGDRVKIELRDSDPPSRGFGGSYHNHPDRERHPLNRGPSHADWQVAVDMGGKHTLISPDHRAITRFETNEAGLSHPGRFVAVERSRKFGKQETEVGKLRKDWTNATGVIKAPGRGPTAQPHDRPPDEPKGKLPEKQAKPAGKIGGSRLKQAMRHSHGVSLGMNGPAPDPPGGVPPPAHPSLHLKHAAENVRRHFGVSRETRGTIGKIEGSAFPDPEMQKVGISFLLGHADEPEVNLGSYNTSPAMLLRRTMRPRMKRRQIKLRLNTQRSLRRKLSGGITRQERWLIGARPAGTWAAKSESLDSTDAPMTKGLIGAAMRYGASRLTSIAGAGWGATKSGLSRTRGAISASPVGRAKRRIAASPFGQKVGQNPRVRAMGQEIKGLRHGGFREGVGATLGGVVGAGIGGKRGSTIGRNVGWGMEYTPWVAGAAIGGAHVLGIGRKKKEKEQDPAIRKIAPRAALGVIRRRLGDAVREVREQSLPARDAIGRFAAKATGHPRVASVLAEAKEQGMPKTPIYRLGRLAGAAIGNERGAKIGGGIGRSIEYAPLIAGAGYLLADTKHRKEVTDRQVKRLKDLPGGQLVLGKGVSGAAFRAMGHSLKAGYKAGVGAGRLSGKAAGKASRLAGKAIRKRPLAAGLAIGSAPLVMDTDSTTEGALLGTGLATVARRSKISRRAMAGGAALGGMAGFALGGKSKWEDAPKY